MKAAAIIVLLVFGFSTQVKAKTEFKTGSFTCWFMDPRKPNTKKEQTVVSPKDKGGFFTYQNMVFVVRVETDNLVNLGVLFNVSKVALMPKPTEKNSAWMTVTLGPAHREKVFVEAKCDLIQD